MHPPRPSRDDVRPALRVGRRLRVVLLWLLALCLPLQGYAVVTDRVAGAGHVHFVALAQVQQEMARGWQALRAPLAPWLGLLAPPRHPMLVHASSRAHDDKHDHQHAAGIPHEHGRDEAGVIDLAGAADDAAAAGGTPKRVLADVESPLPGAAPQPSTVAAASQRPSTAAPAFVSVGSEPLERPPR